ncbi:MAG: type IV pilus assembly protein PilM [Candidatus Staskawiczbacteria bacterium]|nr:type IV pilus assembly protein PilM [Candidatus Staskawiczbacteria bacterium]
MFKFLTLEEEAFGLDINDLSLKIVKLKKKSRGFTLVSFSEEKIPPNVIEDGVIKDEVILAKIIKSAYDKAKGKKIITKYVVASLPEEKSFSQVIQMPKMSEEELKMAVPLEAENYIPMPIDEVYLDFQVISPIKNSFNHPEVLIVAMPKKIVDSYVSCFKKAGLMPIILEAEAEAIARALVKKETNSLLIMVDFGENNTNFIVFSGSSIRFTTSIPISSQSLTKAISELLKISFDEAEKLKIEYGLTGKKINDRAEKVSQIIEPILKDLTDQVKKYLNFYRDHSSFEYLLPEGKTEKIILCGGGAELKGLTDFMSKSLDISVEIGDPLINFLIKNPKNIIKENLLSFTTAIGLALRETNNN